MVMHTNSKPVAACFQLPKPQTPVLAAFSDQNGLALPELCFSLLSLLSALTGWEPMRDSRPHASVPTAPLCNQQYACSMPAPPHGGMSQDQESRACLCACMLLWFTSYSLLVCWYPQLFLGCLFVTEITLWSLDCSRIHCFIQASL